MSVARSGVSTIPSPPSNPGILGCQHKFPQTVQSTQSIRVVSTIPIGEANTTDSLVTRLKEGRSRIKQDPGRGDLGTPQRRRYMRTFRVGGPGAKADSRGWSRKAASGKAEGRISKQPALGRLPGGANGASSPTGMDRGRVRGHR